MRNVDSNGEVRSGKVNHSVSNSNGDIGSGKTYKIDSLISKNVIESNSKVIPN